MREQEVVMKGFIEVTNVEDKSKVLLAVDKIEYVEEKANETFVVFKHFFIKKQTVTLGYSVAESFEDVVAKIKAAE